MDEIPTAPVAAAGMIGGYAVARYSPRREFGGGVLALTGAWCVRSWARSSGPAVAAGLGLTYVAAFAGAHPLSRWLGGWPSALAAGALTAGAAHAFADRP